MTDESKDPMPDDAGYEEFFKVESKALTTALKLWLDSQNAREDIVMAALSEAAAEVCTFACNHPDCVTRRAQLFTHLFAVDVNYLHNAKSS